MTDTHDSERMSDRYAALAEKSAAKAETAVNRTRMAANADEPRDAKRGRKEAAEWHLHTLMDAMRAHGALSAETNVFEATHSGAEAAVKRAEAAKDQAADIYRKLKAGTLDDE